MNGATPGEMLAIGKFRREMHADASSSERDDVRARASRSLAGAGGD